MFESLKKRLKGFVEKIVGKVEEKPEVEKEVEVEEKREGVIQKIIRKVKVKELSLQEFNEIFQELKEELIANNVALKVVEKLEEELRKKVVNKEIQRGKEKEFIIQQLKLSLKAVLIQGNVEEILKRIFENRRIGEVTKFMFVGVNGVGKSTTMAKFANFLQAKGITCVFSASDTFRAAAIEQLEKHANALGLKLIKHQYGADPCAVAYDAVAYAKAHGIDCVLIDTAGRQHSNVNLMEELKKIKRVIKPDFIVFVGDALTGNDAINQAIEFDKELNLSFSIITKADVDIKGGAILSIGYVTGKPILFLGVGQGYGDLKAFDRDEFLDNLLST
ncbi:MAG: signal recognition particle-docking protein FtsY [Candidatus Nanoarchaeia archaeon]|nr:signal recognition particle-docking protein FtsY [Candidatus Haiyanarchaeum thermophilum]MCW1302794.1 signal recognition particle-docking protein FtsY [Candidatus Haiyanarchaeum thermophilum]MCW1304108.1 signal recognition particle-docking protein FtsY [Candidatus Haiyanarchaeum thermophilum]MCW1306655.1 signal recognition particle-docking protein FtsY [Candidatus Haiyanarchaeum thermophilum]MCW1307389.1 signal recognition particle-docking protein FtsY [Candidatus Haiyanarchaeum thermophilum